MAITSKTDEHTSDESKTPAIPTAAEGVAPLMTTASHASDRVSGEPAHADEERVTVTFGYGLNEQNSQRFFVDGIFFSKERIARGIPYAQAKALQKVFGGATVRVHPSDASDAEIARRCGVRAVAPAKVAAMLLSSDLDAIAAQMTPDDLERLAHAIRERAQALHPTT